MNVLFSTSHLALLFITVFAIETLANILNWQTSRKPLPPTLKDMQTPEEQTRASQYLKDRILLSTLKDSFFLVLFLAFLQGGWFAWLETLSISGSPNPLIQAIIFGGVLAVGQGLLSIPFSIYSTFKIESRYGFNRTTAGTFIGDLIKGALVGGLLGGALFVFVVYMLGRFGTAAWFKIWIGYTVFQFALLWIAPVTILPLFLKLSPLADGPLKDSIQDYSKKQNFRLDGAWICDASKRSAKGNAFFTGFGKFRRLVLFDTLIEKHPPAEIVAIVAHEAGHFKLGHIWKSSLFSALSSLLFLYLVQLLLNTPSLFEAFQVSIANVGIGLILAMLVLNKILFFISPLRSFISRKNEFSADHFSVSTNGDATSLVSGLKRLVNDNMATLQHHPLYVILNDSHPPLSDRIKPLIANLKQP